MPDRKLREAARFSARLESVSREAELMFWRFITVPDDFGIYPADPAELRSAIWPANRRHIRIPDVARWRDELVQAGVLGLFDSDGARFVELMRFGQAEGMKWPRRRFPRPPTAPPDAPGQGRLPFEATENRTEEKEKRGARKARKPAPDLSQSDWVSELQQRWPGVDVQAELAKALKRKPDLERVWFAEHWLPKCSPKVSLSRAPAVPQTEAGPEGWLTVLLELYPECAWAPGGLREGSPWSTVPADVQARVRERLQQCAVETH